MSQTGYTPIQLYSSSSAGVGPNAANLKNDSVGSELAINITDGKLFYKDNANSVQVIGWKVRPATAGGTGITSFAVGDLLYSDTSTTLAKLADVVTGNALISGGVGVAPSWGKIGLTTHVSGVLPVANGGTNASSASITAFNNITGYSASGATGTTSTNIVFSTSPSITSPTFVGDSTMSTGNLIQGIAAKGINFTANTPAAGMTSQLLNWYEEGTWTPALSRVTTPPTVTHTTQVGTYTRIGRQVTVVGTVVWSANSGGSGNFCVTGLPFSNNPAANNYPGAAIADYTNITLPAGTTQLAFQVNPSGTTLNFIASGSNIASASISTVGNTGSCYFTFTYFV